MVHYRDPIEAWGYLRILHAAKWTRYLAIQIRGNYSCRGASVTRDCCPFEKWHLLSQIRVSCNATVIADRVTKLLPSPLSVPSH